jgi:serpin B
VAATRSSSAQGNGNVPAVAADEQAFALDLLKRLDSGSPNVVLSPSSIATLLAMLEPGAAGTTRAGIAEAMHSTGLPPTDQASGWHALGETLTEQGSRDHIAFDTANGVWLQSGFPLRPSYVSLLAADFGAAVQEQDMGKDRAGAARAIDTWVASHTGGHIRDLITPPELQQVVAVLVDAVYMKAPWATAFDSSLTARAPFHLSPGRSESVAMMSSAPMLSAPVSVSPSLDAAELAYKGGDLSALVLMPPLGRLGDFESSLTAIGLARIVGGLRQQRVSLQLPKLDLNSSFQLQGVLSAMGMGRAFTASADFSGVSPRSLQLTFVVHDAQMKVTEEGTEASAASGGGLGPTAVEPAKLRVVFNRPFVLMVRDNATGTVLFEAQVTNPAVA